MTFTKTPPSTPGDYRWRANESCGTGILVEVIAADEGLLTQINGITQCRADRIGGEWCRLMPAEEVEKAWFECAKNYPALDDSALAMFTDSRARRVMEGKE